MRSNPKVLILAAVVFGLVFLGMAVEYQTATGAFVYTQAYKYPPLLYYLAFALLVSMLLYRVSLTRVFGHLSSSRFVQFVGASSMTIYLWQIFFLSIWNRMGISNRDLYHQYVLQFVFVCVTSLVAALGTKKLTRWVGQWGRR